MRKRKEGYKNAHYRNIPAYFNIEESAIEGRNWFYDLLIDINQSITHSINPPTHNQHTFS